MTLKDDASNQKLPIPPLAGFLDALIECWLDRPSDDAMLLITLVVQISYLYAHIPALEKKSFVEQMKYENRQLYFDGLMVVFTGTIEFRKHQRAIGGALLQDRYKLQRLLYGMRLMWLEVSVRRRVSWS